jgi:ABC-type branched-subunit amino acid transport system substrate-binding protein
LGRRQQLCNALAILYAASVLVACGADGGTPPPAIAPSMTRALQAMAAPVPIATPQDAGPAARAALAPVLGLGPGPSADGMVRVALLAPLTGSSAAIGQGLLNAAQMALFDGADERFVLQIYDTGGTPDGAAQAAAEAVSHGARLILGPLFAAEARAVSAQADAAGIDVISFSTDPAVASARVHVLGFLVRDQVREVVAYARGRGFSRFAVLAPNTVYGQTVVEALRDNATAAGGAMTRVEYFDPVGADLEDVVRRLANYDQRRAALEQQRAELAGRKDEVSQMALKRLERLETTGDVDFDAIIIPDQGARLAQAASLLSLYDVEPGRVQLLGTMLWNAPGLAREPAMLGALFPAPDPTAARDFAARYRAVYGQAPPQLASHGYDAAALAVVLARGGAADPFRREALLNPAGFAGVDGIFRLNADGLTERGFAILQVTRAGAEPVKPSPGSFITPIS